MRRTQDQENGEGHQEREKKLGQEKVEEDKKEEGWIPLDKEH